MAAGPPDRARWPALSPLLDELLDLDDGPRRARLRELRVDDAALADELEAWLAELQDVEQSRFLQAPAIAPPAGLAGQAVGAYTLVRELGGGGMGSVWLARRTDGRFEGEVAIKFLTSSLFSAAGAERFAREGSIMARLAHPHIARLLDAGHLTGGPGPAQPYLVLEYVAGETIDRHCERLALPVAERLKLCLDVLDAVAHAHNRLILHRDLKPSNILVSEAGEVKLLDFGIAKLLDAAEAGELTQQAGNAFTPQYAAPEQLQGGEVTTATDVYALGVLLYRLLSGRLPLEGAAGDTLAQWQATLQREPPPLSEACRQSGGSEARVRELRGDLDTIVARALKKAPAERYANAAALADDLRRHLADEPIAARPDTWAYRSAKFLRRHRVAVAAGSLAGLALAASTAVAVLQARQAQRQQAQAEGLIEFMLSDLPAKLKPVGRLDALDTVGDKALAYYAAQAPGSLDAASLGRRARAQHLVAEITEQSGRLDEAAQRFAAAAASTGELLARHPGDPEHVFNHAQSEFWVGYIARRRGQLVAAEAAFQRYAALADQLVQRDPRNLDWRAEVAYASENLGVIQLESGRATEALASFERSLQAMQAVLPSRPATTLELANAHGWIAKAREDLNDPVGAIAALRQKFDALARLPDAGRDREAQRQLGVAHYDVARLELALGRPDAAITELRDARRIGEALVQLDPQNLDWLRQLGQTLASQAELQFGQAEGAAALESLGGVLARLRATPQNKLRQWLVLHGRMLALQERADRPGALAQLQTWLDEVVRAEADGLKLDTQYTHIVAHSGLQLGDSLRRRDRAEEAQQAWQAAWARLQPDMGRQQWPAMALGGRLAWRLGRPQEARAAAEKLASSPYRHPDVQALNDELSREALTRR